MKRILLITPDFPPRRGGVARYLDGLCHEFKDQVLVLADHEVGERAFDGVAGYKIERVNLLYKYWWPKWKKMLWLVLTRLRQFDVIWTSHVLPVGMVAMISKIVFRKPYFLFLHGMDFALATRNTWKKFLTHQIILRAELVVTNSRALEKRVLDFVPGIKTEVVYPTVAPKLTADDPNRSHRSGNTVHLLSVSRLVGRKGHYNVMRALRQILDEKPGTKIHYDIVGSGIEYASLLRHVSNLELEKNVTFHQQVEDRDLPKFYSKADIFILPTENMGADLEGFGIVYLEAGLSGLPVIASNLPGVNEAVLDGQTGVLVEPGSVEDIARAIKMLIDNPDLCQKMGQAGYNRARNEFTSRAQAEKLKKYL